MSIGLMRLPVELAHFRAEANRLVEITAETESPGYVSAVALGRASVELLISRVELMARSVPDARPRLRAAGALAQARKTLDRNPHLTRGEDRSAYARMLGQTMCGLCDQLRDLATAWVPAHAPALVPAGRFWDAVRVSRRTGAELLSHLGDDSGAVIADRTYGAMYWLVPPGEGTSLGMPTTAAVIKGERHHVVIPPYHQYEQTSVRWAVRHEGLSAHGWLTEPAHLRTALATVTQERPRRRP